MWKRWKQKIKNMFLAEVESEETEEEIQDDAHTKNNSSKHYMNQNIQTRVTYQYPNRKSFRFPVIPDRPEQQDEQTKTQEYKQKRTDTEESVELEKKEVTPDVKRNKPEQKSSPVRKERNEPFRPTEVASPIYGFQNKSNKYEKIEDVPAFVRKGQKESEPEQQPELTGKPKEHKIAETYTTEAEEPTESLFEQETAAEIKEKIQPKQGTVESPAQKKDNNPRDKSLEDVKQDVFSGKNKSNQQQSKTEEEWKETSQSKQIPFNVMMTPLDKKKLMDKKRAEKQKKEQEQRATQQQSVSMPYHLLNDPEPKNDDDQLWVSKQQELLEQTLKHFNVRAKVVNATRGPSVTRFEVQPELGVKVSKVRNLSDDLKLNMAAEDIRIEAPIPGKNTIGIEVPNPESQMVGLQEVFETNTFKNSDSPLSIALGLSIEGLPMVSNIAKMPHGLIAGATGSGKSVCINTILISLLYKADYRDVKFLLIDPKMVELAPYNGIPHLVSPVITDVKAATAALKWAVSEMEERYEKFVHEGVRDIERYNQKVNKDGRVEEKMPYIVIVIDELADLMMVSPQDVEDAISRIAQKARACGIHLLVATQRPSVDVITGLIKANIPTRIAFSVSSQVDSRTIIDTAGAEKLLGKGDMLFAENGVGKSIRLQGAFVSDEEIERVTNHARMIAPPEYLFEQEQLLEQMTVDEEEDVLTQQAIQFVLEQNSASTSLLQRHFKIGYNRAARLIDTLENRGIISQQNGSKPREVLVSIAQLEDIY